jgi:phospholipid/cholesterol/gamma-HCH transport system substrate-binding protein
MPNRRTRDLTVGVVFALALIILSLVIMAVGGESRLFVQKTYYRVVFPNTDGLRAGSPVKMAGVEVGTVTGVRLSTDPETRGIEVQVGVDQAYAGRVREDSRAALRILQLLSGEKFVEITPGSPDYPELPEDSVIDPVEERELLEQAAVTAENLNEITISLKNILGAMERGEGLIGQMINDPDFGQDGLAALRGSLENMQALTDGLLEGKGFVGRLLYDEEFSTKVDTLGEALDGFAEVLSAVKLNEGGVGALLEEGGSGEQMIEDLRAAAASLRRISERLESNEGLFGRMLNDVEYSDGMALDLRRMVANLAEISEKINRGEGTVGALINDRAVADGLEDVVAGLNDSKFARWLVRRYQKKGIVAQEEALEEAAGQDAAEPAAP